MSEPNQPEEAANKTIALDLPVTEKPGDKIGRYKLLQQIGEGGCGVVYMAEQEEPVHRRVALKVIKLGMDTKAVIARFEAERQALALMDHPNIARVLDAGATETGRPFFVMELVRGIRITDYCDQNKLSTAERLKLFVQVCHAIQHAHQKGIIHRDIKPSNILVTLHDGVPVPKVIDFGIAKATQGRLTDQTLFTAFEQFIGTPAYMSPEQAEMSGLDIDTRSDIYALGVLLYELLTSRTPFDAKELLAGGLNKLRETIREKEPERPSTRLATMLDTDATEVAKRRKSDPPKLVHLLRGDLDWIVMKCLEKDRTRRYETANGLGMDVERYLNDETVLARPPSTFYRFQKLARRNKAAFAAAGAVAAALMIGAIVSTALFVKERHARQRADAAEKAQAALLKQAEAARALEANFRHEAEIGRMYAETGRLLSDRQVDKAEEILNQTPPRPEGAALFHAFGIIHASRGEWQQAITNLNREIEVAPSNHTAYHLLAPLLVQTGDLDGYHRLRVAILGQFSGTTNPTIAERMAKTCLLLPPPPTDLPAIEKMEDAAVTAGPNHPLWPYFEFAKGLTEYRLSRFESASNWLQKVTASTNTADMMSYLGAETWLVLAMAEHQLDHFWPARSALSQGCLIVNRLQLGDSPNDWVTIQILMREALALIETPSHNETIARAFDPLAGRYDFQHQGVNVVTREGNHLFFQLSKQPRFEIFPKSETGFFFPARSAEVTFAKDSSGKVLKAIYRIGETTYEAPRIEDMVEVKVDPAGYDALVGKYDCLAQILSVTREGNRLFAKMSYGQKLEIFPRSELQFFWKDLNAHVTFVKDEKGKVNKANFYESGQEVEALRMEDMVEVKVDPASYDALVGKYDYGKGVTMTVTREESHLFAQVSQQPKMEILPRTEVDFFWKDINAQVTFVKDATGKVTKVIHHQAGQTIEAPKIE
jgi:tetratricopeptide (TPR) repeat protein